MNTTTCAQRDIERVYTTKLFFNEYTCKVTVPFPSSVTKIKLRYLKSKSYTQNKKIGLQLKKAKNKFIGQVLSKLDFIAPSEYCYRAGETSLSFYTNDTSIVDAIEKRTDIEISKISVPEADYTADFLINNPDKFLRDTLFFDTYKFCLVLRMSYYNREIIDKYLAENLEIETLRGCPRPYRRPNRYRKHKTDLFYYNGNDRLYLVDYTDIVLAQITIPDCIERIEEIVLIEDIKNAGNTTS